ncbi:MAG TPA: DUF2314 domain-containing protein [Kofleriaceae bacterium]|jgi:uncharacterized protein YegJ (DUF2314 family)
MVRSWLFAAVLLVGCKDKAPPPPPAAPVIDAPAAAPTAGARVRPGTLKSAPLETPYAVAAPPGAKLAHDSGVPIALGDLFSDAQLAYMLKPLAAADAAAIRSADVVALRGADPRKLADEARALADAAHGWVLDPVTSRVFTAAAFRDHVPGDHLDARKLIAVHGVIGANEQPFFDTEGLRRYGYPEIYIAEAAAGDVSRMTDFINAAAQTLLDGHDVDAHGVLAVDFRALGWDIGTGGTGRATFQTRWAHEPDDDAGADLLLELQPPTGRGTEGWAKLMEQCFGSAPEQIQQISATDPEILAAAAKARADLRALRPHVADGIPIGEHLSVKAKFTGADDAVEWMWVDVVSFQADTVRGTLDNEPDVIKTLRVGQKVSVALADIGDYLYTTPSGTRGGYSIEVMKKRGLVP